MSVVNVKEDYSAREDDLTSGGYSARRRFTVLTDNKDDGPTVARQASGVPRLGDAYPGNGQLLVVGLPTQAVEGAHCLFEVIANYAIPTSSFSGTGTGDPLDEPTQVRWSAASSIEPFEEDGDGNPTTNVNGESFDPPLTDEFDDPVLTITRNEATFDPDLLVTYNGACNSDVFYGAAPGEAKMLPIVAERVMIGTTVAYWRVTYTIQFRLYHPNQTAEQAWWKRVLNQGYKVRTPAASDEPTTAFDTSTPPVPFNVPILLGYDGTAMPDGVPGVFLDIKPPRWRQVPFSALGLE